MTNGRVLVFDIEAPLGFFKISEVTRATISYPFTRTALIGMIGAILGRGRNNYWTQENSLANALIALELINPIKHMGFMVNYGHTKYTVKCARKLSTYIPSQSGNNFIGFVTNVRLDYLRDVHYRIYFKTDDDKLYNELKKHLIDSDFIYPPYLGQANLLADVIYLGESKIEELMDTKQIIYSVIAVDNVNPKYLTLLDSNLTIVMDIPLKMYLKNNKVIHVDRTGFLLPLKPGEPFSVQLRSSSKAYAVKFPKIKFDIKLWESKQEKNIIFMPVEGNNG